MSVELVEQGKAVAEEAQTWPARAQATTIVSDVSYQDAGEFLKGIKALRQKIADTFDAHIQRAFQAHRALCKEKQDAEAPLTEAERIVKGRMADYHAEQERLRREEERRLQDVARREEERRRLEEAAAMEREAQATGDVELQAEADAMIERPIVAPPVVVPRATPKVAGIVHRENWSARVTSLTALIAYVAKHPEHQNLLLPNAAALNQLARAMKSNLKVDGVQAINTPTVAAGR